MDYFKEPISLGFKKQRSGKRTILGVFLTISIVGLSYSYLGIEIYNLMNNRINPIMVNQIAVD